MEILHILLEHSYDSQRNENTGSARRRHRRQPVASSQDLLSPLRSSITALNDVTLEVQEGVRPLADPLPLEFVREFQASALHIPSPSSSSRGS